MQSLALGLTFVLLIAGLSVVARRTQYPAPLIMLAAGFAASFVVPTVTLDPDLVMLLLLPPLLYSSGVGMSWPGFKENLRPILLLAIGCVVFTASAVAAVAHYAFGMSWPVGFVLGAIVSPPDAVAPMAIARRLGLPHRISVIIEGESLVNDATALVIFGLALGAVATGTFSLSEAALRFVAIGAGELGFGYLIGWLTLWVRHKAADRQTELLLALATPFIAFWPPHHFGGSGVIACVTCGLYVSWHGRTLIRPDTRLQGYFIWGLVVWVIEALVFLLTGLQAVHFGPMLSGNGWPRPLLAGLLISLTVIVIRFVWVFPGTYLPRWISRAMRERDPAPGWQVPFLLSWTGLRGVVSLAAALSIPLSLGAGPFPDRDLILFVTFCVIVSTLLGLGTTLPWMIETLGLARSGRAERDKDKIDEQTARIAGVDAALAAIDRAESAGLVPDAVRSLRKRLIDRRTNLAVTADASEANPVADTSALELVVVTAERDAIAEAYLAKRLTDAARRRIERELDLEQARIEHFVDSATDEDFDALELETIAMTAHPDREPV